MKRLTLFSFLSILLLLPGLLLAAGAPISPHTPSGAIFVDSGQALGDGGNDVALGDLDSDGDLDAFVATASGSEVWLNQSGAQGGAAGIFLDSGQSLALGDPPSTLAVALGDLDGDGDLDAFAIADRVTGDAYEIWINQGGAQGGSEGTFAHNGQLIGDPNHESAALGDLDGDGDLDAFLGGVEAPHQVWWNDGSGTFSDSGQSLGDPYTHAVALGDVDGDGDLDAFTAESYPNKVWLNQGGAQGGVAGQFADSGQSLGDDISQVVALGDIDGDGDLDAFVGNAGTPDEVWINQGGVQGGSEGIFLDSGQVLGEIGSAADAVLADLDNDGDLDVFIANVDFPGEVWVNQGGAQGGVAGILVDNGQSLALGGSLFANAVALGDVDGDGDLDAFVASDGPNEVWLNQSVAPPQSGADLSISVLGTTYVETAPILPSANFDVTVHNHGPELTTGVTVQGSGAELLFSNGSQGQCGELCQEWLFGDLTPGQSATVDYGPIYGTAFSSSNETIHSAATAVVSVSGMEVDPNWANNSGGFTTFFYNCDLLTCWLERLFCKGGPIPFPFEETVGAIHASGESAGPAQAGPDRTAWLATSPLAGLLRPLGDFVIDLAVYYYVRDDVLMGTADGQHYVDLYYTHDPEITALLDADPALEAEAIATLQLWEPNLWALVEGDGDSAIISAEQVQAVDNFLTNLSAVASPELQQVIAEERERLGPPEEYVGMSMDEARGIIVGYGVKLPMMVDK